MIHFFHKLVARHKKAVIINYILLILHISTPFINLPFGNSNFNRSSEIKSIFSIEEISFIFNKLQNNEQSELNGNEQKNVKDTQSIINEVEFFNQQNSYKFLVSNATFNYTNKLTHCVIPRSPPENIS